jgi:pilus assembly protein CpaC
LGLSGLYRDANTRAGTGTFKSDNVFDKTTGAVSLPGDGSFLTVLSNFGTDKLLVLLDAEEQAGNARILAEPSLLAGNKEPASFLAGGELPIPVAQGGTGDIAGVRVTITYREFGVRLNFLGEIISDSLVKLQVKPEVSSLDYGNAIVISGFSIPAFRTRRVETTVDVKRNQSLVISGLFNNEEEKVKTGIPLLMHIPILGQLFSSTRYQRNESELVVIVTPVVVDPMHVPSSDVLHFVPESTLPAIDALRPRLVPSVTPRVKAPATPPKQQTRNPDE